MADSLTRVVVSIQERLKDVCADEGTERPSVLQAHGRLNQPFYALFKPVHRKSAPMCTVLLTDFVKVKTDV